MFLNRKEGLALALPAALFTFLVFLVPVGILLSVFYVDERELAVNFRFGEIIDSEFEPGTHFKVPVVHNVTARSRIFSSSRTLPGNA